MSLKLSIKIFFICIILASISTPSIYAQSKGNVAGIVTDATDGSTLWGANIIVDGTSQGTATDRDGKYRLVRLEEGRALLLFMYLGYETDSVWINVIPDRTLSVDVALSPQAIEGTEVVVTAQMQGQAAAINQQLTSNTIVNVVSKDKIQELPDQNAAESVGRLPGISVERDAGEGQKIVIRGLSPKFNSVTINGERIPSTDPSNRSVDLSMISPDMLEGIEVYKSLTPDKEANSVGGSVNFIVKKAPEGLKTTVRAQTGYNDHESELGQYKMSLSSSDRFLDNKLGLVLTGNIQRANRSSDQLNASYDFNREQREGEERAVISVHSLNLVDILETRDRYGLSLALDYDLGDGEMVFNSMWSRTDRDELRRRKRYRVSSAYTEYEIRDREINTTLFSNSLNGKYDFNFLYVDWKLSYSKSMREIPFSHTANFRELGAFNGDLIEDQGPELIPLGARENIDETFFQRAYFKEENVDDQDYTAQVNLKMPFGFGDNVSGYVKMGGKFRDKKRNRDNTQYITDNFGTDEIGRANPDLFDLDREGRILFSNFVDPDFDFGDFLDGAYTFGPALDVDLINQFGEDYNSAYKLDPIIDLEDYSAGEKVTAGYLMAEINIGPDLMILPGFRYEYTENDYSSWTGTPTSSEGGGSGISGLTDTTGTRNYDEFMPMIQMRYNIMPWMDVRVAVTKSLSRPDYFNLVPWERISYLDTYVERGNPNLKHTTAWNYDLFLSVHNLYGLFTLGGFYKELENIDYISTSRIQEPGASVNGFQLTQPVNSEGTTTVYGFEIELQTNLRFLPSPFDGIILYANYTNIHSETFFPLFEIGPRSTTPPYAPTIIDTVRSGRMPGQADQIANFAIGYEKGGFSGRLSMTYQGESIQYVGSRQELDGFTDAYIRWDLILQQKVMDGLNIFLNINNLTNRPEKAYLGIESFLTDEQYYGWTADLGVKYSL